MYTYANRPFSAWSPSNLTALTERAARGTIRLPADQTALSAATLASPTYRPPTENENDGETTGGGVTYTGAGTMTCAGA